MKERFLEQFLQGAAADRGWWAPKLVSPGNAGMPDRLVIAPASCPCCGRTATVGMLELKAPGEVPRPLQHGTLAKLRRYGVPAGWADSREGVLAFLDGLRTRQNGAGGAR